MSTCANVGSFIESKTSVAQTSNVGFTSEVSDYLVVHTGPVLLLQSSEIPERVAGNNTWNCSVPFWPHFQRHFRCNLRQECVNGEDEVLCPYSTCRHGGVSFAGHCYFMVSSDSEVPWIEAQQGCRKVGAYLASLTSPGEWSDVMSWLHLSHPPPDHTTSNCILLGLATTLPNQPHMFVDHTHIHYPLYIYIYI